MELKKWLALALAGTMCFSMLAACGGDEEEYTEDEDIAEEEIVEDEDIAEDDAEAAYVQIPATVINGTGVSIAALYVSGAGLDTWGDNMIPEGKVLPHGNYMDLTLNVDQNNMQWDIRIEDLDGTGINFQGLDISEMPAGGFGIELLIEDGIPTAAALADPSQMSGDYAPAEENTADVPAAEGISQETWARICVANAYMAYELRNLKAEYLDQGEMPEAYAEIEVPLWDLLEANKGLAPTDYDEDSAAAYVAEMETYLDVLMTLVPLDMDAALAEAGLVTE